MFRTIILRSDVAKELVRKSIRAHTLRNIALLCTKRRHYHRLLVFKDTHQMLKPWTTMEENFIRCYSNKPAHTRVTLPALSPTMESGTIISWAKKEGDKLNEGDLLAEIETDKATMGFETPEEGYLAKILIPAGTANVPIGKLVCIIVQNESDVAAFKDFKDDGAPSAAAPTPAPASPPPPPAAPAIPASNMPSHARVTLPALSPTMENGTIISWGKKEGDKLNEGDLLAEIETDKATMGFETPEEGYLAKILIPAGTSNVPIGKLVCIIVENEADVAAFKNFKDDGTSSAPAAASASSAPSPSAPSTPDQSHPAAAHGSSPGGRVYVSPMAKRLAEQQSIRLQGKGSGLFGSFRASDLKGMAAAKSPSVPAVTPSAAAAQSPSRPGPPASSASPYSDIPVSGIRKTIAKRLLDSKQQIPHYYLSIEVNVDQLLKIREKYNKKLEKSGVKLSVNDFIIKAVAMASKKVPDVNASWMDSVIRQYKHVDVSVAVSTDKGLITPIVFEADGKGIAEISKTVKTLAGKARDGKLQPHEFQGGTISISNLGMFGINQFAAILNPPQSCILAIGTTVKRLVSADNEKGFKESGFLTVTLSCDHRVVDGAVGAQWLQAFKENMEDPISMII